MEAGGRDGAKGSRRRQAGGQASRAAAARLTWVLSFQRFHEVHGDVDERRITGNGKMGHFQRGKLARGWREGTK